MRRLFLTLSAVLPLALPGCGSAQAPSGPAPLILERTIPLSGVKGRIDHLSVDVAHRRLFIAELGNGTVEAVDLDSGQTRRIGGLLEPQGVAYLPSRDELVVATGGDGTVRFFDGRSLAQTGMVQLGSDADDARFDAGSGTVAIGYGSGAIALIDGTSSKVIKSIAVPAHPESFVLDPAGPLVFVNLPNARTVAAVDRNSGGIAKRWPAAHLMNFPMALDAASRTLAVVYRWPARLVLTDADTGKVRQDLSTCSDADDLFFDQPRSRIYVVCGAGSVDVFESGRTGFTHLTAVPTRSGARTGLFVPEFDRLFVAARAQGAAGAALLELRPTAASQGNLPHVQPPR